MSKKLTTEEFINKSKKIHGDKFDYSLVEYVNYNTKVKIICPKNHIFEVSPVKHIGGGCCSKCVGFNLTNEEILEKLNLVHNNKYDYPDFDFKGSEYKYNILCKEHGIFQQSYHNHLVGKGCSICGGHFDYTTETYIEKCKITHGDKYDYSLINYINSKLKVEVICSIHGLFKIESSKFIGGAGCQKCSRKNMFSNYTLEEYIEKCNKKHNYKYNYNHIKIIDIHSNIKLYCEEHGLFEINTLKHKHGDACPKCKSVNMNLTENFINKSNIIHKNRYDYSKSFYINTKIKVKIICSIHGEFEQTASKHLGGSGCQTCAGRNITTEETILKFVKIHGDKYNYSLVNYVAAEKKVKIICSIHGVFEQTPHGHCRNGCSKCNTPKGEIIIEDFLKAYNIKYETQKKFDKCKYKRRLAFDFYLPEYNLCIEYDGIQHFFAIKRFGGEVVFKETQLKDSIKNKFCLENNIDLLRIPYIEIKNIISLLKEKLNLPNEI